MRLRQLIESVDTSIHQGTSRTEPETARPDASRQIVDGLAEVRKTNDKYFRMFWTLLVATFVLTVVLALMFRQELGGMAAVLGAGGIIQGGLLTKLSAEWKEKSRTEMVMVLASVLPPKEMVVVLKEVLARLSR